ncbi:MAG: TIGR04222 domain-containing membrane protein, partial [Pseudonocardia sp.]
MALAAATAETWGISGPTFLLAYLLLAVAVGIAVTRARRALAEPATASLPGGLTANPHDVAYLNGGGELAVYSALSAMHLRGTIITHRGEVQATGRLEPATDTLERAIHFTANGRVPRRRLEFHRPVQTALSTIEDRLVAGGFLLSEERRRQIRWAGLWMLAVAGLGLLRLLAGVAEARPVGFLIVMLLLVTGVAVAQLS